MLYYAHVTFYEEKMNHPEWATKFKTKGTELRLISGRYYLYQITSKYDKERKVTKKITLGFLGRITEEDGLIPKGENSKRKQPKASHSPISTKEHGASSFLTSIADDIKKALAEIFPKNSEQIFAMAVNRLLYQSPLKNMDFLYQESFISNQNPELDLSKNTITNLMQEIGRDKEQITKFLEKFITGAEHIIFDTTHIVSNSRKMGLNQVGYNSQGNFDPQVNLFYMFSTDKQLPVYYRIFPGNITGMKALKIALKEANLKNCAVIGDKGFASESNISALEEGGQKYIIPLRRNHKLINYERLASRDYDTAYDGHFFYQDRTIFYYQCTDQDRKITTFFDQKLRTEEENSYLHRIAQRCEGYSMDNYKEKQLTFGTLSVITNISDISPEKIYQKFKSRMEVETLFDMYKNLLNADRTYMQTDQSFEAWMLINHIASILYYKVFNILKEKDLLQQISPADLLLKLSYVKKLKVRDQWLLSEINSKSEALFKKLCISIT